MAKAKMITLEDLHALTATELAKVITHGVPVVDRETGEVVDRAPAPAAYFASAIKFLKDNDITAELAAGSPLEGLVSSLPTFNDDTDDNDLPVRLS